MKFKLSEVFAPRFFEIFKKGGYSKNAFIADISSGITVGILALPLAIAFAIASGVSPKEGIITAIIAGFVVSAFGGSSHNIGGPVGAAIVIIYGIVSQFGLSGLIICTMMAGIILIAMGIFRLGGIIKFIPYPIVCGFTTGIAITIASTQINDFLGLGIEKVPCGFIPQWEAYISNFTNISLQETLLGVGCMAIILLMPKVSKKIPGPLAAIFIGTIVSILTTHFTGYKFATIGSKFPELADGIGLPVPHFPTEALNFETLEALASPALTLAILIAIESLLCSMVADSMTGGKRHDSNTELIAQGGANFLSGLFGGIPAASAIARTAANITNGAKSSVSGIVHSIVLLLILLFLMPYATYIPLASLAAILLVVSRNMADLKTFKYILKGERTDMIVLVVTCIITVLIDLTVAIEVGLVLAVILFVKRISETTDIKVLSQEKIAATEDEEGAMIESVEMLNIERGVEVYAINGPFFFGLAQSKLDTIDRYNKDIKVRIIRMKLVPFIDSTGVKNLRNIITSAQKRGIRIILSGVRPQVLDTLCKYGLDKEIGEEFIFDHITKAVAKANEYVESIRAGQ